MDDGAPPAPRCAAPGTALTTTPRSPPPDRSPASLEFATAHQGSTYTTPVEEGVRATKKEHVRGHACCPHVHWERVALAPGELQHLRWEESWRPLASSQQLHL